MKLIEENDWAEPVHRQITVARRVEEDYGGNVEYPTLEDAEAAMIERNREGGCEHFVLDETWQDGYLLTRKVYGEENEAD